MKKEWAIIQKDLEKKLSHVAFETWVKPLEPLKYSKKNKTLYILVHRQAAMPVLENRLFNQIQESIADTYEEEIQVILIPPEEAHKYTSKKNTEGPENVDDKMGEEVFVDPMKTFETFVVGENNRFAQAAAHAVAESPGKAYNPLFIYGGAGLGKTHLMHSIGHYVTVNNPKLNVLYVDSEMFTDDFINALRNDKMSEFKSKYRNVDILLLDDIQFIQEKTRTREEVFHTYNTLHDSGKQLVFSSDRPPKDLLGLDERLTSRLSSGLIVDIHPPSFETKVAILLNKANLSGIEITDGFQEVIELIANKITSNIREMEGALNKVLFFSSSFNQNINKDLASEILKDIITDKDAQPTPDAIKKNISKFFDVKISDLESNKRARTYSYPRQIAMYLCRDMTDLSTPKIGEHFGGRDHTTVLHACEKIEKEKKINETLNNNLKELEKMIRNI